MDPDDPDDERDDLSEIRSARDQARVVIIAGEPWRVFELRHTYDRRGPSLVFESEQIIRVVRQYPEDWKSLPDNELVLLSAQR